MSHPPHPSPPRRLSLLKSSATVASAVYAGGNVAAAVSIGFVAVIAENSVRSTEDLASVFVMVLLGQGVVWYVLMKAAIVLRTWVAALLVTPVAIGILLLKLILVSFDSLESINPSITPHVGEIVAVFADPILLVSYAPVWRMARDMHHDEMVGSARLLAASAFVWFASVSLLGVVIAPSAHLKAFCAIFLGVGIFGIVSAASGIRAKRPPEESERKPESAKSLVHDAIAIGGTMAIVIGCIIAILRLNEQSSTLDPAIRAVYRDRPMFNHCYVDRASGGKNGIVLVRMDCGEGSSTVFGWDEQADRLIEDELLRERFPELRSGSK